MVGISVLGLDGRAHRWFTFFGYFARAARPCREDVRRSPRTARPIRSIEKRRRSPARGPRRPPALPETHISRIAAASPSSDSGATIRPPSAAEHFLHAPDGRRDRRHSRSQGLDQRDREAFEARRQDEHVELAEEARHVLHRNRRDENGPSAQPSRSPFPSAALSGPRSGDDEMRLRALRDPPRRRSHEDLVCLLGNQSSGGAEDDRARPGFSSLSPARVARPRCFKRGQVHASRASRRRRRDDRAPARGSPAPAPRRPP